MMMRIPPGSGNFEDPDGTDTLPVPQLDLSDTGTLDLPAIAAIPVGVPDLAQSLRDSERRLEEAAQRLAKLEPQLAALNQRCAGLQAECDALRAAAAPARRQPPAPVQEEAPAPAELDDSAARHRLERDLAGLRRQNERLHEALGNVQALIGVREGQLAEAEAALRQARLQPGAGQPIAEPGPAVGAAPEPAPTAPPDLLPQLQALQARCAELEAALEAERERAKRQEQLPPAASTSTSSPPTAASGPQAASQAAAAPALPLGTVLRVLVRLEGDTEVVYPLGRHTTIGRTPDNDIQVNATFVSRHHAVLLAGTDHCIVEDLNSTNGLLVNGQRTGRQVLHDGDTVTIGKTHFRYQQRS
jgi:hypothetical protein